MPVLITGAETAEGRAAARRFRDAAGGPMTDSSDVVDDAATVLSAAIGAGRKRQTESAASSW